MGLPNKTPLGFCGMRPDCLSKTESQGIVEKEIFLNIRDILEFIHSNNFLKIWNLETSLLSLLKMQTFIIVYNIVFVLDPRPAARRHTTAPISHPRPSPVARKLLLISRPAEGRRLS